MLLYAADACASTLIGVVTKTIVLVLEMAQNPPLAGHYVASVSIVAMYAGVSHLLQQPSVPAEGHCFASVEGLPCQAGLLDGPTSLLEKLLACGPSSDAGLAAIQAGQPHTHCILSKTSFLKQHQACTQPSHCLDPVTEPYSSVCSPRVCMCVCMSYRLLAKQSHEPSVKRFVLQEPVLYCQCRCRLCVLLAIHQSTMCS